MLDCEELPERSLSHMKKVSSPRRFVRVPGSVYIGKMAREVWKVRPKFDIRETEGTTEFVFRLKFNIPKRIKDSHEAAYQFLFRDTRADWKRTFKLAYSRTRHGGKKAKRQFDKARAHLAGSRISTKTSSAQAGLPTKSYPFGQALQTVKAPGG